VRKEVHTPLVLPEALGVVYCNEEQVGLGPGGVASNSVILVRTRLSTCLFEDGSAVATMLELLCSLYRPGRTTAESTCSSAQLNLYNPTEWLWVIVATHLERYLGLWLTPARQIFPLRCCASSGEGSRNSEPPFSNGAQDGRRSGS
jgi:hypothetical protein